MHQVLEYLYVGGWAASSRPDCRRAPRAEDQSSVAAAVTAPTASHAAGVRDASTCKSSAATTSAPLANAFPKSVFPDGSASREKSRSPLRGRRVAGVHGRRRLSHLERLAVRRRAGAPHVQNTAAMWWRRAGFKKRDSRAWAATSGVIRSLPLPLRLCRLR